jgi:Zn ribbon nucleic-acid-binding protein
MTQRTSVCPACHVEQPVDHDADLVSCVACGTHYRLRAAHQKTPTRNRRPAPSNGGQPQRAARATIPIPKSETTTTNSPTATPATPPIRRVVRRVTSYVDEPPVPEPAPRNADSPTAHTPAPAHDHIENNQPRNDSPTPPQEQPAPAPRWWRRRRGQRDDSITDDDSHDWVIPGIYR